MKRIKKLAAVFLLLLLCTGLLAASACAAEEVASGTCGKNLTWVLDSDGTLTISGTGAMTNYTSSSSAPWYSRRTSIKNVVIGDGVTSIGCSAFGSCTNLGDIYYGGSKSDWEAIKIYFGNDCIDDVSIHYNWNAEPAITKLENTASGIKVTWGAVEGAESYRLFVKTSKGWAAVGTTTGTTLTYTGAETVYPYCALPDGAEAKKILCAGDSIAYGARNDYKGFVGDLGVPYKIIGKSGATLSNSYTEVPNIPAQLIAEEGYEPDIVIANGGINDYLRNVPMGTVPDAAATEDRWGSTPKPETVLDGLECLLYNMREKYPNAEHYFLLVHKVTRKGVNCVTTANAAGYTQTELFDAIKEVCGLYGVSVVDVFGESCIDTAYPAYVSPVSYLDDPTVTDREWVDADGLHPLAYGYLHGYVPIVRRALGLGGDDAADPKAVEEIIGGYTYTFTVRCLNTEGTAFTSFYNADGWQQTYVAQPAISKLENTASGVKITWGAVSGAGKYRVYAKTSTGWLNIGTTTGTSLTYTGAKSGYTYTFTVRALNSAGTAFVSSYNTTGWKQTYVAQPSISKLENTASGIKITWNAVSGAGKYRLFVKTSKGWLNIGTTTGTSLTYTGAKSGYTYTFTVRAMNAAGTAFVSSYNTTGWKQTYVAQPSISKLENTVSGIKITWNAVSGAGKYRVFVKTSKGWATVGTTTGTSLTWTGAKSGYTYTFTVRALNSAGTAFVSSFNSTGWKQTYVAQPAISKLTNTTSGIKVTWSAVSGAAKYRVFVKTSSGWAVVGTTSGTSLTWTGAKSGYTYTFTVRAMNSAGTAYTSAFNSTGWSIKRT